MPGRMHEVELVEAADEPARSHPAGSVDEGIQPQSWVRRRAPWLVTAAALVVGSLAVTQLVLDHREDARVAALAGIPGVLPPVDESIGVLWRADAELAPVIRSGALVDDVLVGGMQDPAGAAVIVGLDPATGEVAWRTPVDLPTPQPTPTSASAELWISCTGVQHGPSHVAACTSQQYGEGVQGIPPSAVWVLDPVTGDLLTDRVVPGGWGLTFIDDALVVAEPVADDGGPPPADADAIRWKVSATDVVSGATVWTWTTPLTDVVDRAGPDGAPVVRAAALQALDDHLVLRVDSRGWALTTDGEPVIDVALDADSWLEPARAGVFLESSWTSSVYSGTLLLTDGTRVPIDETAGFLSVDDGSAPDVVFTVGQAPGGADGLTGRSARTGEPLWHVDGSIVTGLLLDGVVFVATSEAIVAVEATSGDVLWSTAIDHMPQQLSTDGRYLLLPGPGVTLEAYTLTDGRPAWTADLAQEVAGEGSTVFIQGFQSGWRDPRLYVWMDTGDVAVLG